MQNVGCFDLIGLIQSHKLRRSKNEETNDKKVRRIYPSIRVSLELMLQPMSSGWGYVKLSKSGSTEFPLYRFYGQYILPEKVNIYAQKLPRLQIKEEIQMIRFVQDQSNRTLYNLNTARYSKIVPLFLPLDKPTSLESTEPTEKQWTALFISQ